MLQKLLAICSAGLLCGTVLLTPWTVSAEETAAPNSITLPKSEALYYEIKDENGNVSQKPLPESQITGQIAITVHDNPIHVSITRQSAEAPLPYYDMDLSPEEGQTVTEYVFLVDYSECPSDPSQFETTYSSPNLTSVYSSAYTVEISAPATKGSVYSEDGLLIADPHAESVVTGVTRYSYDVTFSETLDVPSQAGEASPAVSESGDLTVSRSIQLFWKPYTLGDADNNGSINADDAYWMLLYYAKVSVGAAPPENVSKDAADVDKSGDVTANDAYLTLKYYAMQSVGSTMTFEEFLAAELG